MTTVKGLFALVVTGALIIAVLSFMGKTGYKNTNEDEIGLVAIYQNKDNTLISYRIGISGKDPFHPPTSGSWSRRFTYNGKDHVELEVYDNTGNEVQCTIVHNDTVVASKKAHVYAHCIYN